MTFGACVTGLRLPDRNGKMADVVLGYDDFKHYLQSDAYAGATIGRVANRISRAQFQLDGKTHALCANDGVNHLHGGKAGFDKAVWNTACSSDQCSAKLVLKYVSTDGEEGYPGVLSTSVAYALTDNDELSIDYVAETDAATLVNLTNHTYFNLSGTENVLDHWLTVDSDRFTPLDVNHIPTGEILPISGSKVDFRSPTRLGSRLERQWQNNGGFNHNLVLNSGGKYAFAARLHDPKSGRVLELWTDQPGIQLYTGQYLRPDPVGKNGVKYGPYSGVCLEPQKFPDAANRANFPSIVLRPGQKYSHKTVWKFSVE